MQGKVTARSQPGFFMNMEYYSLFPVRQKGCEYVTCIASNANDAAHLGYDLLGKWFALLVGDVRLQNASLSSFCHHSPLSSISFFSLSLSASCLLCQELGS